MKLDPKGVEAAAYEIFDKSGFHSRGFCNRLATAALTAYFDHLKSEGLMREAHGWGVKGIMNASTISGVTKGMKDFPAFIIRTDKE